MSLKLYPRPSGVFHIRGTVQGRSVDQSARTRVRAEAEAIRAQLEADLFKRSVYGDKAVAVFAEAAADYMEAGGSKDHLTPLLLEIGNTKLSAIDQAFVDRLAKRLKPDAKPSTTIRQIYTPISAVMNFAATQKLCDPVRFRKPEVPRSRIDYLMPAEVEDLLRILPDYLFRLVIFLVGTGCRISEAVNLDWKDVSPEAVQVTFWDTKMGYARTVELQQRVRMALPKRGEGKVFRNSRGDPWHGYDAINLMLKRHITRHEGMRQVHCHLFRHTWATWAYAVTRDLALLMSRGGWRSADMVFHYSHAGSPDLGALVKAHGWEISGKPVKTPRKSLNLRVISN